MVSLIASRCVRKLEQLLSRNIWVLLVVSALFGLAGGMYELVLPFFLRGIHLSYFGMALVYAIPFPFIYLMRVYVGDLSDFFGRKIFYSLSLAVGSVSTFLTPLVPGTLLQMLLKTSRDATLPVREAMHSLILYEEDQSTFTKFIGRTRGSEFVFLGIGALLGGYLTSWFADPSRGPAALRWGNTLSLMLAGGFLLVAFAVFSTILRQPPFVQRPMQRRSLKEVFTVAVPPKLALMTAFGFVFNLALSISHTFYMPLFFQEKFGVSLSAVAAVMAIHRFTLGVPLVFAGSHLEKHPKAIYMTTVALEGGTVFLAGFVGNFYLAAGIWLLHDLVGAGIWTPIQQRYIQQFARAESRGADVSKSLGLMQLGNVIGPFIAAALLTWIPLSGPSLASLPFIVSGAIVALSSLVLLPL